MGAGTITLIIISSLIALIILIVNLNRASRRSEFKDWKIGDYIKLISTRKYVQIVGWNSVDIFIKGTDSEVQRIQWSDYSENKSAIWRRYYETCKKDMGVNPGFTPELKPVSETYSASTLIDGKPIETLSEIECQVYLKQCITSEEYEKADLIRKRLTNFR